MPRPCAVETHAGDYEKAVETLRDASPCAVETHAGDYEKAVETLRDATALRRGDSRWRLRESCRNSPRCHGLAPWRFTLDTTGQQISGCAARYREAPRHKAVAS